jgi:hypothetical protein
VIQEEFLRVEKQKLEIMEAHLSLNKAAFEQNRELLRVQTDLLAVIKSWEY